MLQTRTRILTATLLAALAALLFAACPGSGGDGDDAPQTGTCANGAKDPGETDVDCGGPCNPCANGASCIASGDCQSDFCGPGYTCWPSTCGDGMQNPGETDVDCGGTSCPACLGEGCADNGGCVTGYCNNGVCDTPSCTDAVKNGKETGVDCGGADCPACPDGEGCLLAAHCESGFCNAVGTCAAPTCDDGAKNQDETDVDCGGEVCGPCGDNATCVAPGDCQSTKCVDGRCDALPAHCFDRTTNEGETDVDCGGTCAPCGFDEACGAPTDCRSQLCEGGRCSAPAACSDAQLSPGETDVDCGGTDCPPCAEGKLCTEHADCATFACVDGRCEPPSCTDGVRNGDETDTDCGGFDCPQCDDGQRCREGGDCIGGTCTGGFCGSCEDGVKNGDETAVDCGGTTCEPCELGAGCVRGEDCETNACGDDDRCCAPNACGLCGELGAETCNGVDDDCNGETDDGLSPEPCPNTSGVCAGATAVCGGTAGWTCGAAEYGAGGRAYEETETTCDNLDNDCDGQTDEVGCEACGTEEQAVTETDASDTEDVLVGHDFFTWHAGAPMAALAYDKGFTDGTGAVVATDGLKTFSVNVVNGPGIASDGTDVYVAFREDLGGFSHYLRIGRISELGLVNDLRTKETDVPAGSHATPIAVGGGKGIVGWVNDDFAQMIATTDDLGSGWTDVEVDDDFDSAIQVEMDAQGVGHAVWRADNGSGPLRHWTDGAATIVGSNDTAARFATAIEPSGRLHLVYAEGAVAEHRVYEDGGWSDAQNVATSGHVSLAVAVAPEGRLFAALAVSDGLVAVYARGDDGWSELATREIAVPSFASLTRVGIAATDHGVVHIAAVVTTSSVDARRYVAFAAACEGYEGGATCTPDCSGRDCGDDGCGGTCAPGCDGGETCNASTGQCEASCTPDCSGRDCGDDGCGGTCAPGCGGGETCNASTGQCEGGGGQCSGSGPDPNSCRGACGVFFGEGVCNCDELCAESGDCCADFEPCCVPLETTCGSGANSCSGRCGANTPGAACQCDNACTSRNDCCDDLVPCCAQ